jgi:tetratricopeptide (TPR) repeat protein
VIIAAFSAISARAADVVERKSVSTPVSGTITEITRDGITLTVGSLKKVVNVPSNDVVNVRWNKEPAKLNLLRADERAGRLQKAVDGYAEILKDVTNADRNLKTDLTFLIARAMAKLALADPAKLKEAISLLDDFVKSNSTSFRYYEAVEQLGRLYVSSKDFAKAGATYAVLRSAPWPDYQMSAQIAEARVQLLGGNVDGALATFEQVSSAPAKEPA